MKEAIRFFFAALIGFTLVGGGIALVAVFVKYPITFVILLAVVVGIVMGYLFLDSIERNAKK